MSRANQADTVLLYYHYGDLSELQEICRQQVSWCEELKINGRIRVAKEGLNGTLDGNLEDVNSYMQRMDDRFGAGIIDWKLASYPPDCNRRFKGLSVKECKEVISLDVDVKSHEELLKAGPGLHLTPAQWHEALLGADDSVAVIDCRNYYETRVGRFETKDGSKPIDPFTRSFSAFRHFVDDPTTLEKLREKKKILMYCTGGVRCERASAYLKSKLGATEEDQAPQIPQVFQLLGGIHRYQEQFPNSEESLFKGKNFVYDPRITVGEGVTVGTCLGCQASFDDYTFQVRCSVCRVLVLACTSCRQRQVPLTCEMCVAKI
jgi:predicted sulfurtransferase